MYHEVEREVSVREVALRHRLRDTITVETYGCGERNAALVGPSQHLEVVHGRQVVACDGFGEGNLDVVADAQNAVGGLRCAEGNRTTRILDTCQDIRRTGQVTISMTAYGYGTQVVVLLDGVNLAIEVGIYESVIGHQLLFS